MKIFKVLKYSYISGIYNLNLASPKIRKQRSIQVRCFHDFLVKGDTTCRPHAKQIRSEYGPNLAEQYRSAAMVVLATGWSEQDLELLPNIIEILLDDKKRVLVVSNTPNSETFGEKQYNRFDRFLFESGGHDLPTDKELRKLELEYFADYSAGNSPLVNKRLQKIVNGFADNNVVYADRSDYMCEVQERRCLLYFPSSGAKVLWDNSHITTEGARELGKIINKKQWLGWYFK